MGGLRITICGVLLSCLLFSVPGQALVIAPSDVVIPDSNGGLFSFDLVVSDFAGDYASGFQVTMTAAGLGILEVDSINSRAVESIDTYWLYGNSGGARCIDLGSDTYQFGDNAANGVAEVLIDGEVMARYAFTWDGVAGDYSFSFDLDSQNSFIMNPSMVKEAFEFDPGGYLPGDNDNFTIYIPESATIMLLGIGSLYLLRKRT